MTGPSLASRPCLAAGQPSANEAQPGSPGMPGDDGRAARGRGEDWAALLQWALPRLDLAWPGFRKVRGQVCKRVRRRMKRLGLADFDAYRARLEADPKEWRVLDGFCRITISRFFRDRGAFEVLRRVVLPEIARRSAAEQRPARIWSAGCASGEEPYTVRSSGTSR